MQEIFGLDDLLHTLVSLEELGNKLYIALAEKTSDAKAKSLFSFLSEQENMHRERYSAMLDKHEMTLPDDSDYSSYIKVLVESTFSLLQVTPGEKTVAEALSIGMQLEKETILFLSEICAMVGAIQSKPLQDIILQERGHLRILVEFSQKHKM